MRAESHTHTHSVDRSTCTRSTTTNFISQSRTGVPLRANSRQSYLSDAHCLWQLPELAPVPCMHAPHVAAIMCTHIRVFRVLANGARVCVSVCVHTFQCWAVYNNHLCVYITQTYPYSETGCTQMRTIGSEKLHVRRDYYFRPCTVTLCMKPPIPARHNTFTFHVLSCRCWLLRGFRGARAAVHG